MAQTIKRARKAAHLSQMALSALANVSQTYISDLEMGRQSNPSHAIVLRLEKVLGVSLTFRATKLTRERRTRVDRRSGDRRAA